MKLTTAAYFLSTFVVALGAESSKRNVLRGSGTNEEGHSLPARKLKAVVAPQSEKLVKNEEAKHLKSGKDGKALKAGLYSKSEKKVGDLFKHETNGDTYPADFYPGFDEGLFTKSGKKGKGAKENDKKSNKSEKSSKLKLVK